MISSALSLDPLMREAAGSDPLTTWTPLWREMMDIRALFFCINPKGTF